MSESMTEASPLIMSGFWVVDPLCCANKGIVDPLQHKNAINRKVTLNIVGFEAIVLIGINYIRD